jgi:predicted RNA-binding Zn-ribbon protein involved in translation (DUF1610 family)
MKGAGEGSAWCSACGRRVDVAVLVPIHCPACGAEARMRLCPDCARRLRDLIDRALGELSDG